MLYPQSATINSPFSVLKGEMIHSVIVLFLFYIYRNSSDFFFQAQKMLVWMWHLLGGVTILSVPPRRDNTDHGTTQTLIVEQHGSEVHEGSHGGFGYWRHFSLRSYKVLLLINVFWQDSPLFCPEKFRTTRKQQTNINSYVTHQTTATRRLWWWVRVGHENWCTGSCTYI